MKLGELNRDIIKKEFCNDYRTQEVRRMRLELTRPCDHYPLKVACIPISPPARENLLCPKQGSNLHNLAVTSP